MKITDVKNVIKAGLPNLKQALFYAYNDPACQAAEELHIIPETAPAPKNGKVTPEGKRGTEENDGNTANSETGGNK
jgi:hypothetical protein